MQTVTIESNNSEVFIIVIMFAHQTAERKVFVPSVEKTNLRIQHFPLFS